MVIGLSAGLVGPGALAQPQLPAGLKPQGTQTGGPRLPSGLDQGPKLPSGLPGADGEFEDWPEADDSWASAEDGGEGDAVGGFWELRLGQRHGDAADQRDASLGEMRLELEKDWRWQGGGAKVTTDLVYDWIEDSRHLDLETGAGWLDLREAWVEHRLGSALDIKAGRQILTWGVGDLLFINDLFPKDWNSFLAGRDEQFLKAPSDAIRLGWYGETLNLNLVYTPRFDADRYIDGRRLSYFSPLAGTVVGGNQVLAAEAPRDIWGDDEWAARLYRRLGSYEVAVYGYSGFWKSPGGFDPLSGSAVFPRLRVVGASARGPLGPGIVSLELGRYHSADDSDGSNPLVNNSESRALAGYEWELMTDTTLGLQYYVEVLGNYSGYRATLPQGHSPRDRYRQLLTLRLTRLAMGQNLTASLFLFYSPTDNDAYARPKVNYKITDNWAVAGGMNLFAGRRDHTFFGQFEDNANVYVGARYSF